jgi:hypothetical protein
MDITSDKSSPNVAEAYLRDKYPDYFKPEAPILANGQKKRLWDIQYKFSGNPTCSADASAEVGSELDCIRNTKTGKEMCFLWGSNATVPLQKSSPFESTVFIEPILAKEFSADKLNPIAIDPHGQVYLLQSYMTEKSKGVPTFPGATTTPGEESNICAYLQECCPSLPSGWKLQCGRLSHSVACGKAQCNGSVTKDDAQGTWCAADDSSLVDVCAIQDDRSCGCPGTPSC